MLFECCCCCCLMITSNNGELGTLLSTCLLLVTPVDWPTPATTWTLGVPTASGSPVRHLLRFGPIHRLLIRLSLVRLFGEQPLCKRGSPYVLAALPTCCMSSSSSCSWLHYPNDKTVVRFSQHLLFGGDNGRVWGITAKMTEQYGEIVHWWQDSM